MTIKMNKQDSNYNFNKLNKTKIKFKINKIANFIIIHLWSNKLIIDYFFLLLTL